MFTDATSTTMPPTEEPVRTTTTILTQPPVTEPTTQPPVTEPTTQSPPTTTMVGVFGTAPLWAISLNYSVLFGPKLNKKDFFKTLFDQNSKLKNSVFSVKALDHSWYKKTYEWNARVNSFFLRLLRQRLKKTSNSKIVFWSIVSA